MSHVKGWHWYVAGLQQAVERTTLCYMNSWGLLKQRYLDEKLAHEVRNVSSVWECNSLPRKWMRGYPEVTVAVTPLLGMPVPRLRH